MDEMKKDCDGFSSLQQQNAISTNSDHAPLTEHPDDVKIIPPKRRIKKIPTTRIIRRSKRLCPSKYRRNLIIGQQSSSAEDIHNNQNVKPNDQKSQFVCKIAPSDASRKLMSSSLSIIENNQSLPVASTSTASKSQFAASLSLFDNINLSPTASTSADASRLTTSLSLSNSSTNIKLATLPSTPTPSLSSPIPATSSIDMKLPESVSPPIPFMYSAHREVAASPISASLISSTSTDMEVVALPSPPTPYTCSADRELAASLSSPIPATSSINMEPPASLSPLSPSRYLADRQLAASPIPASPIPTPSTYLANRELADDDSESPIPATSSIHMELPASLSPPISSNGEGDE
ncbi:flocculation protein FLO11-like [Teleopsis dalmanni]|uniref:flocculation protein FLO11-like n=1 Tax=Teleopsis dalmanni TaxID=139649 RepID=UPI0018CCE59C|nr:flocculation protein FLO11-like [Teleopsis dalmanni]